MLFLMNDVVLTLGPELEAPPLGGDHLDALTVAFVTRLGQEIFAETPLLHREEPDRARRLALLILSRAPEVNAALFCAPRAGCRPDEVSARLANVDLGVMLRLEAQSRRGSLTPVSADREVWRRLAA